MNPIPELTDRPAHVLIVDDDLHNRQVLEAMLAPEAFADENER
ncbi:MAG TPA: hypothetical protein VGZ27_02630 [Vicinamibacterales bacterium]|jgi:CheY-like chemotaxis protein|nr:hypothetical protein [Vicinamibacterales bacterium]